MIIDICFIKMFSFFDNNVINLFDIINNDKS